MLPLMLAAIDADYCVDYLLLLITFDAMPRFLRCLMSFHYYFSLLCLRAYVDTLAAF